MRAPGGDGQRIDARAAAGALPRAGLGVDEDDPPAPCSGGGEDLVDLLPRLRLGPDGRGRRGDAEAAVDRRIGIEERDALGGRHRADDDAVDAAVRPGVEYLVDASPERSHARAHEHPGAHPGAHPPGIGSEPTRLALARRCCDALSPHLPSAPERSFTLESLVSLVVGTGHRRAHLTAGRDVRRVIRARS
jgi:hypothetical protein